MIIPPKLKTGEKIAIVSPAGFVNENYVTAAKKYLSSHGFKPQIFSSCLKSFNRYAGTDIERLKDLQNALDDDSIKAVLCARGGYGCIRIINEIDFSRFVKNPKWVIGFSDISTIHSQINSFGVASIHGPMAKSFSDDKNSEANTNLIKILKGTIPEYEISGHELNREGEIKASIVGGNLSTLFSLQSTDFEVHPNNKILFIEDVNEYLYHLDRIMMNFKLSGKLKNIKGLIVGAFSDMIDSDISFGKTAYEIILEHVSEYNYPILFNFPSGHIINNMPIVFGVNYYCTINKNNAIIKI